MVFFRELQPTLNVFKSNECHVHFLKKRRFSTTMNGRLQLVRLVKQSARKVTDSQVALTA